MLLMRRLVFLLLPALAAGCAATGAGLPDATPEETLEAWSEAWVAGELDRMLAFYDDSDDLVVIHSSGHVRRGHAELVADYETAFEDTVFEEAALDLSEVGQAGGAAWATGRLRATSRRRADDSRWRLELNTTFVLRSDGDAWRIVLEQSTPVAGIPRIRPLE